MTYGLTLTGFVAKRLEDCRTELEADYRDAFGDGIKTTPDTVFGKLIGIHAEREASLWELAEAIYNSQYPNSATGLSLANIGQITDIAPNPATRSTVDVLLLGNDGVIITAGTRVATVDAGDQFEFSSNAQLVDVQRSVSGITRSGSTATATSTAHGLAALSWVYVSGAGQAEYNGYQQILTVPTADSFTFAVTGTPATPATGTITADPAIPATLESVETGPVPALAGTLTEIVNPVIGWLSVYNLSDAILGTLAETDAEFRVRRLESISGIGAARQAAIKSGLLSVSGVTHAAVFVNDSDVTDGDGRPPHSIECLVVGGVNQDLFDKIWEKKAAGIQSYGNVTGSVTDSNGDAQTVKFSRATDVNIWVEVDLTTDATFPLDGTTLVRDAILTYGEGLDVGDDVIVYPGLITAIGTVQGITDIAVRVGTAINPTLDNNIAITAVQLARFDSARIEVVEL